MEHAITVKDIAIFVGVIGGIGAVLGCIAVGIYLMNPFRSGH